LDRVT